MQIIQTPLQGLFVIEPKIFKDDRGFFYESFNAERYKEIGIIKPFVQDNLSRSQKNVLRGLHYQIINPQAKLVTVLRGKVFDVAVDIRKGSKTFGQWFGLELSEENHKQLYIPEGFAHGFCVLSDSADFFYKCTDFYNHQGERSVRWDDHDLAIQWPVANPILSPKDIQAPLLSEVIPENFPRFENK